MGGDDGVSFAATLRWVVASSATSYGYTLTVWAASAVVLHHRGIPTEADALAFVLGAIAAFAVVGFFANRGVRGVRPPRPRTLRLWQALHLMSVVVAIGGAAIVTRLLHSWTAWPVSGFIATGAYLVALAAQLSVGRPVD
jgi:hypothetical protein